MAFRVLITWNKEDKSIKQDERSIVTDPFSAMDEWVENFFEDPFFGLADSSRSAFNPSADLYETENEYTICVDLPGMEEKDIDVVYQNNTLTIRGSHEEKKEESKKQYYRSERRTGSFQRSFALPDGIDESKIEAEFKNGVLNVHLPKTKSSISARKQIPIQRK
jgi:HSP20 family protein